MLALTAQPSFAILGAVKAPQPMASVQWLLLLCIGTAQPLARAQTCPGLWARQLGPLSQSSPAIGRDGTIYIANDAQVLFSLAPTGRTNWFVQTGWDTQQGQHAGTPVIAPDDSIYCGTNLFSPKGEIVRAFPFPLRVCAIMSDGGIYAWSARSNLMSLAPDGSTNWSVQFEHEVSDPIIGPENELYVGGAQTPVTRRDSHDGSVVWTSGPGSPVAIDGAGNICSVLGSNLFVLHPDGTTNFTFAAAGRITTGITIGTDGTLYFGDTNGTFFAVNTNYSPRPNGVPQQFQRWRFSSGGTSLSTGAAAADGTIYMVASRFYSVASIYAIGTNGPQMPPGYPVSVCGSVFLGNFFGSVVTAGVAISTNGSVYVVATNGLFLAVRGSAPLANSAWAMESRDPRHTNRSGGAAITEPVIEGFTSPSNGSTVSFSSEVGRHYSLQSSASLTNWSIHSGSNASGDRASLSATNIQSEQRFFRISSP